MSTTDLEPRTVAHGPSAVNSPGQVLQCVPMSAAARSLVTSDADGVALVRRLVDANFELDALKLIAYLLPIRKAIWWGCLCAWHGNDGRPEALEDDALLATVAWVREPGESEWKAAELAANADGSRSAGGCCAQSIGWAGFLTPSDEWVPRDLRVAARLIAGSVLMVSNRSGARPLLALAVEVARGLNRWEGE